MNLLKNLFVVLFIGGLNTLYAQKIDPKAKRTLDMVSSNYQSKKNICLKFSYTIGKSRTTQNQTGIFYASKDRFRFKMMGNEQIFDGKKIYNINEEEQEITIAKPTQNSSSLSPINYIESYKKGHHISLFSKKNNEEVIKLVPVKNNGIKQVLLYINPTKKQVQKIEQFSNDNTLTKLIITEYKENLTLKPNLFSFDKNLYKNYLITEL
ncbi:MAG: outer membrane lipoprotein carrier protein LolA [Flavobacteriaceae bacterium]|nr:outer membrane lipoprotein carrier protein LolA [Flavobacteriaceae bacterium]